MIMIAISFSPNLPQWNSPLHPGGVHNVTSAVIMGSGKWSGIGRLFQGLGPILDMPTGTNCLFSYTDTTFPKAKETLTFELSAPIAPKRLYPTSVLDQVDCTGNVSTNTADVTTTLLKSVLSMNQAKFMTLNLSNFYLESHLPLGDYEYVKITLTMILVHIQQFYQLAYKVIDSYFYAEICHGMYGLPQAGKLANQQLQQFLHPHGITPCPITPGLWQDASSDLMFTLVVDNIGVQYTNHADVEKLLCMLET